MSKQLNVWNGFPQTLNDEGNIGDNKNTLLSLKSRNTVTAE